MKFMEHRRTLEDSLGTEIEIPGTVDALLGRLSWLPGANKGNVAIGFYGFDRRLGKDVYIVTVDAKVVGWTDGPLKW
jgi:hypothetical protein